jgi:hypothetical protein
VLFSNEMVLLLTQQYFICVYYNRLLRASQ